VVVLGVNEGDVETPGVKHLGEVQQGRDVALRRVRDEHGVRAAHGAVLRWTDRVTPLVEEVFFL
jgi:hypothetical protein